MNRILKAMLMLANLGTHPGNSIADNGNIRLINVYCFLAISISIAYIVIGQIYSTGLLAFELPFLVLSFTPLVLNYFRKTLHSKLLLLLILHAALLSGTFFLGYSNNFKFGIIIPIILSYWFFHGDDQRKLLVSLTLSFAFCAFASYHEYSERSSLTFIENLLRSYDTSFYLAIVANIAILQLLHSRNLRIAEDNLSQRLDYEKSIANFSETILGDLPEAMNRGLHCILEASKASRVYIFENHIDSDGNLYAKQTHEVCASQVDPELSNPLLEIVPYASAGFSRWEEYLSKNIIVQGLVRDFPEAERELLTTLGVKSTLVIPIFESGKWSGLIGFEDVREERIWKEEDIGLLSTVAGIIGLHGENRKHQQVIAQQNVDLTEANAAKDKLFSIVAHDLREPFTGLVGLSGLLAEDASNFLYENIEQYSSLINTSAKNALSLVDNLLTWARSQSGAIGYSPKRVDIAGLIAENIELVRLIASQKQITIENLALEEAMAMADGDMIRAVIRNLLTNAIKFTDAGGVVKLGCDKPKDGTVRFFIQDSGTGMSTERVGELFKLGKGRPTKGTSGETGTGLGLHLCSEFIEKHSGSLWVESEEGIGSIFHFSLPIQGNCSVGR